jgi:hypothetical protein
MASMAHQFMLLFGYYFTAPVNRILLNTPEAVLYSLLAALCLICILVYSAWGLELHDRANNPLLYSNMNSGISELLPKFIISIISKAPRAICALFGGIFGFILGFTI